MHFISGQSFTVSGVKAAAPTGAKSVTGVQPQATKKTVGEFNTGEQYLLYYIRNNTNKFHPIEGRKTLTYTFLSEKNKQIEMDFDSSREADEFIASLTGAQVPNYAAIYERRTT